jgi:hypothetical protein
MLSVERSIVMSKRISVFRSLEARDHNRAAFQTVLDQWPVPYEELTIHTRFGATSVIACGPGQAPPVVLLHPGDSQAPIWVQNIRVLSQSFRVYAVDVIGELNKCIRYRPIRSHRRFMEWLADLFDGLLIENADVIGNSDGWFFALETALYLPRRARRSPLKGVPEASAFSIRESLPV